MDQNFLIFSVATIVFCQKLEQYQPSKPVTKHKRFICPLPAWFRVRCLSGCGCFCGLGVELPSALGEWLLRPSRAHRNRPTRRRVH
jgi:hypothetical protein